VKRSAILGFWAARSHSVTVRPQTVDRSGTSRRAPRFAVATLATILATVSVAVLPAQVASAATQNVTNCGDSGLGSLPNALFVAAPNDMIAFTTTCPAASPIDLTSPLVITKNVTITGPGAASDLVVNGQNNVQVFHVNAGVTASITGITVENGRSAVGCGVGMGCSASGGGIENEGTLTVTDVTLTDNTVVSGCVANCGAFGGGIENDTTGNLTVVGSTFTGNTTSGTCDHACSGNGGGIINLGALSVTNSSFSNNSSGSGCNINCAASGGGIENGSQTDTTATATVTGSSFNGNSASLGCPTECGASGGGIDNWGTLTVTDSSLTDNSASVGCNTECAPFGGGIANELAATLTLTDDTLSANSASTGCMSGCSPLGGGLYNDGTVTVGGTSIINSATLGHDCFLQTPLNDLGTNHDDDGTCFIPGDEGSAVRAVVEVHTSPSFAGDAVHIDSSQLQSSCKGHITFETLQGGSTVAPRISANNIIVILDDDGNVTVTVNGVDCAPGTDVVEADLTVAPFLTALTTLVVEPPQVTAEGLIATPSNETETGDTSTSGDSDVYTVFNVETNPVYAEQTVEISSPQLESRCIEGWRWEPGTGPTINQTSGTTVATGILDDDGNATFVFKGRSCATGPSAVIADVMAGTHPTYVTTFTVSPPVASFPIASGMMAASNTTKKAKTDKHPKHHKKHKGGAGAGSGSGGGSGSVGMTVTASPNALILTGLPFQTTQAPTLLNITKTDNEYGHANCDDDITFTITVTNGGPGTLDGVVVSDDLLGNPDLTGDHYTAVEMGGATGASGTTSTATGDINDTVNLPPESSITYTVTAYTSAEPPEYDASNTATATPAAGAVLATGSNSTATDNFTVDCG